MSKKKCGIIFGAAGTLGRAVIFEFLQNNETIYGVLHGSLHDDLEDKIEYYQNCNIAKYDSVLDCFESYFKRFSQLDFVINCVGITGAYHFIDSPIEEWERVYSVNFTGAVNICKVASQKMVLGNGGSIILVGSPYGTRFIPNLAHYCVSKASIAALAKTLSVELASYNIRVNVISPGIFPSILTKSFIENTKYMNQLIEHIPDKKIGNAYDIAKIIRFLTTDACSHINGTELVVDGGYLNLVEGGISR